MTFHKTMKRLLASSLTTVIIGSTALSLPAAETAPVNPNVPAATPTPALPDHTFFLDGSSVNAIVNSMEEAAAVIENIKEKIGGDERTVFEPWRTLTDSKGNNYCVFMQMYSNVTVSGGAVKVPGLFLWGDEVFNISSLSCGTCTPRAECRRHHLSIMWYLYMPMI